MLIVRRGTHLNTKLRKAIDQPADHAFDALLDPGLTFIQLHLKRFCKSQCAQIIGIGADLEFCGVLIHIAIVEGLK